MKSLTKSSRFRAESSSNSSTQRTSHLVLLVQNSKNAIHIVDREDDETTRLFWKNKTPEERLSAVEFLREQCYSIQGYKAVPSLIREIRTKKTNQ